MRFSRKVETHDTEKMIFVLTFIQPKSKDLQKMNTFSRKDIVSNLLTEIRFESKKVTYE